MKKFLVVLTLAAAVAAFKPASAQSAAGYATRTPTPAPTVSFAFEDAALHFAPSKAFLRMPAAGPKWQEATRLTPMAAWVRDYGKEQQQTIVLAMEVWDGTSLDGWEAQFENEIRQQIDGVFVSSKKQTKLGNGMPAYFLKLSYGEGFSSMRQFVYVYLDGRRGVALSMTGRLGELDDDKAKDAMKDLIAVAYPYGRL